MSKILVIGQTPSARKQEYPYDSTQFYDWLAELGVGKEQAQKLFDFDAVYDKFLGFKEGGGHRVPTKEEMDDYWERSLNIKVALADKILLLGNVAKDYFYSKDKIYGCNTQVAEVMHPSRMNFNLYQKNKQKVLQTIKSLL